MIKFIEFVLAMLPWALGALGGWIIGYLHGLKEANDLFLPKNPDPRSGHSDE